MADGSIAGIEPRKTDPTNSSTLPPAQKGAEAAAGMDASKVADTKTRDPLRDLIDKLEKTQALMERLDRPLASTIKGIAEQADVQGRLVDPTFRTRVAYAAQDVEKHVGPITGMQGGLREEMTRLAATYPGLRNERMQDLVRSTPGITDKELIRDIRKLAVEVVKGDQASPDLQSKIGMLESRVRVGPRTPDAEAGPVLAAVQAPAPASSPMAATAGQSHVAPQTAQLQSSAREMKTLSMGAASTVVAALRNTEDTTPAPWDQNLTPLTGRIAKFLETAQANREGAALKEATRSGEAAVQALQAFATGPGSGIMSKISAAAKADPDGMAGVVAGMREGGSHADLRQAFDADLARNKGLAAAVDRAAAAVGQYGRDRTKLDSIAVDKGSANTVAAGMQRLDAQLGKAASETPHRAPGKSLAEELGEKAAELVSKAVEAVKAFLKQTPAAEHRPSGPSPL